VAQYAILLTYAAALGIETDIFKAKNLNDTALGVVRAFTYYLALGVVRSFTY